MIDRRVKIAPRPDSDPAACRTVAEDIRRLFGRERALRDATRTEIEFLMSMGLLVKDQTERVRVLQESMYYVRLFGGPDRPSRR